MYEHVYKYPVVVEIVSEREAISHDNFIEETMIEKPPVISLEISLTEKWEAAKAEAGEALRLAEWNLGRIANCYGGQLSFDDCLRDYIGMQNENSAE